MCRESAIPGGKRYCVKHMAEYLAKNAAYAKVRGTLRCCTHCGEHLSLTRHNEGEALCGACQTEADRRDNISRQEVDRIESFQNATTVDALKAWIVQHCQLRSFDE